MLPTNNVTKLASLDLPMGCPYSSCVSSFAFDLLVLRHGYWFSTFDSEENLISIFFRFLECTATPCISFRVW